MTSATDTILRDPNSFGGRLSNSSTDIVTRLKQPIQGTGRNKYVIEAITISKKGQAKMINFREFLRKRRGKANRTEKNKPDTTGTLKIQMHKLREIIELCNKM